jgi:hypothetical protein
MAHKIRRVDYFYATIEDPYELLAQLANLGLNLLALTAVPLGPERTQLALFPEDAAKMVEAARKAGLVLDGPHRALLVHGDDELGALAKVHAKLHSAQVHVYASSGVTDGKGSYGYIIYVRPDEYERAAKAMEV